MKAKQAGPAPLCHTASGAGNLIWKESTVVFFLFWKKKVFFVLLSLCGKIGLKINTSTDFPLFLCGHS